MSTESRLELKKQLSELLVMREGINNAKSAMEDKKRALIQKANEEKAGLEERFKESLGNLEKKLQEDLNDAEREFNKLVLQYQSKQQGAFGIKEGDLMDLTILMRTVVNLHDRLQLRSDA